MDHANPIDTDTNHSTLLKALSWISVVASFLFIFIRTIMKWTSTRSLGVDDFTIILALGFAIAGSVCMTLAASLGYGSRDSVPDDVSLLLIEKYIFSFNILFFLGLGSSMLSITDLIYHISPVQRHRRFALATGLAIVLWTIIAILGFSFQCRPDGFRFLTSGQCIGRPAFYTALAIVNLILEACLVFQPTILTWALNMSVARRVTVIICFLGRLLVIPVLIAQIVVIWHRDTSIDILMDFGFVLTTILILHISIITSCTPYLRPFFLSLHTAQMNIKELPGLKSTRNYASGYGSRSPHSSAVRSGGRTPYSNGSKSKRSSRLWVPSAQDMGSDRDWKFERLHANSFAGKLRPDNTGKRSTTVTTSQISDHELDYRGNIEQTVEFTVEVETIPQARQ